MSVTTNSRRKGGSENMEAAGTDTFFSQGGKAEHIGADL